MSDPLTEICQGAHLPGDKLTILRPYNGRYVQMVICERCGVPIPPKAITKAKKTRNYVPDPEKVPELW